MQISYNWLHAADDSKSQKSPWILERSPILRNDKVQSEMHTYVFMSVYSVYAHMHTYILYDKLLPQLPWLFNILATKPPFSFVKGFLLHYRSFICWPPPSLSTFTSSQPSCMLTHPVLGRFLPLSQGIINLLLMMSHLDIKPWALFWALA